MDLDKTHGRNAITARELLHNLNDPSSPWKRPLDLGAHSRSSHSGVLAKLTQAGLVIRRQRGSRSTAKPPPGVRGSWEYRLSDFGLVAILP